MSSLKERREDLDMQWQVRDAYFSVLALDHVITSEMEKLLSAGANSDDEFTIKLSREQIETILWLSTQSRSYAEQVWGEYRPEPSDDATDAQKGSRR